MSQIWAKSNFELVPTVGRYLRKAALKKQIKSVLDQNELKLLHESLNPYLSTLEV